MELSIEPAHDRIDKVSEENRADDHERDEANPLDEMNRIREHHADQHDREKNLPRHIDVLRGEPAIWFFIGAARGRGAFARFLRLDLQTDERTFRRPAIANVA